MMVAIFAVVLYKEVGPFWDIASDLLSYVCGWQVVFCTIALLLKDNQLFESKDAEATASGLLIFLQVLIVFIAISAQVTHTEHSTRVTQSGRFTKNSEGPILTMPTMKGTMPRLSMAAVSRLPSLPQGLVTTPRGSLYTPRGSLFRASESSARNEAGEKAMPAVKSDGASGSSLFSKGSGSAKIAPEMSAPVDGSFEASSSSSAASSLSIIESGKEMDIKTLLASSEAEVQADSARPKTPGMPSDVQAVADKYDAPARVTLAGHEGAADRYMGAYDLTAHVVNDAPLFVKTSEPKGYLYRNARPDRLGKWSMTPRQDEIEQNKGIFLTVDASELPTKAALNWQHPVDGTWVDAPGLTCT